MQSLHERLAAVASKSEVTSLTPPEETKFKQWATANKIPDVDHPDSFYDYRGYWKEFGDKPVRFGIDHFTDTYKQHGHPTFSVESKYSKGPGDGGTWNGEIFTPSLHDRLQKLAQPTTPESPPTVDISTRDRPIGFQTPIDLTISTPQPIDRSQIPVRGQPPMTEASPRPYLPQTAHEVMQPVGKAIAEHPATRAVVDVAKGLVTPENVAIGLASMIPVIGPVIGTTALAYYTPQALKGVYNDYRSAEASDDPQEGKYLKTRAYLQAIIAALPIIHLGRKGAAAMDRYVGARGAVDRPLPRFSMHDIQEAWWSWAPSATPTEPRRAAIAALPERAGIAQEAPMTEAPMETARPPTEVMPTVQPVTSEAVTRPSISQTFEYYEKLRAHPVRGAAATVHVPGYEKHIERLAGEVGKVQLDVQVDYLDQLIEGAATFDVPQMIPEIEAASQALLDDNLKGYARHSEKALSIFGQERKFRSYQEAAKKVGLEKEATESIERQRIETDEPARTASESHLIRQGAQLEMRAWAQAVHDVEQQMQRGESAQTAQSNVSGKAIEEAQTAKAAGIRSLGVKEGSPLAAFKEAPAELAAIIEKDAAGKVLTPKETAIHEEILRVYEKTYADRYLPSIQNYLKHAELQDYRGGSRQMFVDEQGEAIEPPADVGDISFDFGGESGIVHIGAITRPIHNVRQAIFETAEQYGEAGLRRAGAAMGKVFEKIVPEGIRAQVRPRPESYIQARRELRGETAEVREQAEMIGAELVQAIPDEDSRVLAAKIAQNTATPAEIIEAMHDPAIMATAEFVKNEFMRLGEQIVLQGVGRYAQVTPANRAAIAEVIKGLRKLEDLAPELRPLATTGIGKYFGEYLPRLYRSKEAMNILKRYGISRGRVRQEFSRLQKRNEELSPELREAMLEITEIVEPAVKGIFQEEMLLARNRFFEKIAANPELTFQPPKALPKGATKKEIQEHSELLAKVHAPSNWRKLPDSDTLGPLSGRVVEPSVYRDMMDYVNMPGEALKIARRMDRLLKKSKTVYNPASHVRNYESNWIARDAIIGMDFTTQAFRDSKSFVDIVRKTARFKEARMAGLFETDYATLDLTDMQIQHVTAPTPKHGISGAVDAVARIAETLGSVDNAAMWMYRMEDDVPKLGLYSWLRDAKGMSPEEAVKRTLDVLPDYSEVLPFVQNMKRIPLLPPTFISWASIMPARMIRAALKHPLRAGKWWYLGQLSGLMLIGAGIKTYQEISEEEKELPGYMKPGIAGATKFLNTGARDSKGRSLYFDLTWTLPFGDILETSGMFGMPGTVDIGILPSAVLDAGRNYNNFGSYIAGEPIPIYNAEDSGPTKAQKTGAYLAGQLLPTLTPGVGFGARRLESAILKKPSYYGQAPQDLNLALMQVLAGQKTVAIDKKYETIRRQAEVMGKLGDINRRMASTRKNQSLSEAEKRKEILRLQADKERVILAYKTR